MIKTKCELCDSTETSLVLFTEKYLLLCKKHHDEELIKIPVEELWHLVDFEDSLSKQINRHHISVLMTALAYFKAGEIESAERLCRKHGIEISSLSGD